MTPQLHRLSLAFALAFLAIALTSGYWSIVRQSALIERADNPRRVLSEQRVRRGTIYDRNGVVLAESVGAPGDFVRHYPYPALSPVLGHISAFYGSAGIEAAADGVLHGDAGLDPWKLYWEDNLLGMPPPGRDVRLSIDLRLQTAADSALGNHTGAVVLLDAASGEVLALASHPNYNANQLETQWPTLANDPSSPLLNRATFALYQPGGALEPILLGAALEFGFVDLKTPLPQATSMVKVGDLTIGCRLQPLLTQLTLAEALTFGCPRPFADLGEQIGPAMLDHLFTNFRLYEAPTLSIPTTASPPADSLPTTEAASAALGQGKLNLTPLHLALITAAIAHRGEMPVPQLLTATQNPQGEWQPVAVDSHPIAVIPPEEAEIIKGLLTQGHSALAFAGAEGKTLAWFSGFAPFEDSRYAVVVLLEDGKIAEATEIGHKLLANAVQLTS
jgi:penicillin-binding protein A